MWTNPLSSTRVTSRRVEAVGFFSCGLRVKRQSSPKDVTRGVFVSLGAMRASLAFECRLVDPILRCRVPRFSQPSEVWQGFGQMSGHPVL